MSRHNPDHSTFSALIRGAIRFVCDNCGEISIQPEVAAELRKTIWERKTPARVIEAAVYEFSR
ncbi:hypothetical protein SBA4_3190005 [Candidatus Sulfopaludibacter sp. SbA4]|nr:hypothetical protein SBA4_3190005 [Candidatus Sulfopaludibacter sp. SbA4]